MMQQSSFWTVLKRGRKIIVLLAAVLAVVALFQFTPLSVRQFTPTKIKDFIVGFGVAAPLIFIAIYATRAVVLVIPVGVMSLAGGLAFGKWLGTVYILMGATIGSCLSFLLARYFGRGFVESFQWLHKGRIKTFDEKTAEQGFKLILFLRLVPLFQYDAVNFGAGLSKVKFHHFALGSLIGMAPGGFINAYLGSSIENPLSVHFIAALAAFAALMFIPLVYRSIKRAKGGRASDANLSG
jgi:uncharacterized membrane protein YdjX (TVP38/TMEM64 family)